MKSKEVDQLPKSKEVDQLPKSKEVDQLPKSKESNRVPKSKESNQLPKSKESKSKETNAKGEQKKRWIPSRYVFLVLAWSACLTHYILKVNLSLTIVSMVTPLTNHSGKAVVTSECLAHISEKFNKERQQREFDWDEKTKGILLSSLFWGYIITHVPSGMLAERYGAKHVLGYSFLATALLTFLSPASARLDYKWFMVVRFLEGLALGFTYPAVQSMIAKWAPKYERSLISTVIYSGAQFGSILTMSFSGMLASSVGWPSVFYVSGVVGIVWYVAWCWFAYETPMDDPKISNSELAYILEGQNTKKKSEKRKVPYKAIFTSMPVWAIIIANIGQSWGYFTLLLQLPSYFENVLGFNLKTNGFMSALPYVLQVCGGWSSSYVSDRVVRSQRLQLTTIRKIWNSIGHFGPAICLFLITIVKCNTTANVVLLCIALFLNSFMYSGFHVVSVDMAPDFAGFLMGLSNGAGSVAALIAPYLVSVFTQHGSNLQTWAYVFYISSGIFAFDAIVFIIFGSSKLQPWAAQPDAQPDAQPATQPTDKSAKDKRNA